MTQAAASYLTDPRSTIKEPGQPERYRWPARAALDKLFYDDPGPGRPNYETTLQTIASCPGDLDEAAVLLGKLYAKKYPKMGDPARAARHIAKSLRQFRKVCRPGPHRPAQAAEIAA